MFAITKSQLSVLGEHKTDKFIQKSISFLKDNFREWCSDKDDLDLKKFILQIINTGEKFNIKNEINIQKLMHYEIEFHPDLIKYSILKALLTEQKIHEDIRIENFYLNLVSGNYKLIKITLNTQFYNR